jgi:DNA-directed RNA polymerase subunit F
VSGLEGKARFNALREKAIEAVRKALDNAASYLDPEELRELVDELLAEDEEEEW